MNIHDKFLQTMNHYAENHKYHNLSRLKSEYDDRIEIIKKLKVLNLCSEHQYSVVHHLYQDKIMDDIGCAFDGKLLHVLNSTSPWIILHELCHWMCATPDRRTCREYGLGSFDYEDKRNVNLIGHDLSRIEEIATCILSALYEKQLGIYPDSYFECNMNQQMVRNENKFTRYAFMILFRNKMITEDFQVTGKQRMK